MRGEWHRRPRVHLCTSTLCKCGGGLNGIERPWVSDAIERYILASRGLAPASEMKIPVDDDDEEEDDGVEAAAAAAEAKVIAEEAEVVVEEVEEAAEASAAVESSRDEEIGAAMEEAKRMNAELLQASKMAAERLAKLQGSLKETEEALKAKEGVEAEAKSSKATSAAAASPQPPVLDLDCAAGNDADSWEDIAANEQTAAVAAAAEAAKRRAEAAAWAAEAATAADAEQQQQQEQSNSKTPSWGSIGSFFAAALKTVTAVTSPEARLKQAEAERAAAKATLLGAVVSTNIGRDCSAAQLSAVESAVRQLEALNPTASPTRSTLMRGRWSAVFTNSRQLLGLDKKLSLVRQSGPVYFAHDFENGRSEVQYTWPVKVDRAELKTSPDGYNLSMNFEQTKLFGMFAMPGGQGDKEYGQLEVTYLDLDMKLCRGGKGTIYVFVQTNSNYVIGDTTSGDVNKQLR